MTDKQFATYYGEAINYTDPAAYASDVALSLLDPDNPEQEVDPDIVAQLTALWHVANDHFREFLSLLGLNQSQCARRFCIPLRTVQHWAGDDRACPPYIRLMMAELVGLVDLRDKAQ